MKKIIGILGVAVIAVAMYLSTSSVRNTDTDLASLMAVATANAQESGDGGVQCHKYDGETCNYGNGWSVVNCRRADYISDQCGG